MGQSKENWDSQGGEVGHFSKMQISNGMAMMTWKIPAYVTAAILFVSRTALVSLKILWFARGSALPKGHFSLRLFILKWVMYHHSASP